MRRIQDDEANTSCSRCGTNPEFEKYEKTVKYEPKLEAKIQQNNENRKSQDPDPRILDIYRNATHQYP